MLRLLALCLALVLPAAAQAQDRNCIARVNHQELIIVAGTVIDGKTDTTLRERFVTWPRRQWNSAWGTPSDCDSATIIAFLGGMMSLEDTEGHCLVETADRTGYLLAPGERNFRGMCRITACDRVNMLREESTDLARRMTELATGQEIESFGDGVNALAHGSGALMMSGQGPMVAEALGTTAGGLSGALASPAALAAAGVTVIAVGGAVYLCSN